MNPFRWIRDVLVEVFSGDVNAVTGKYCVFCGQPTRVIGGNVVTCDTVKCPGYKDAHGKPIY
jgi:hypothetical protein